MTTKTKSPRPVTCSLCRAAESVGTYERTSGRPLRPMSLCQSCADHGRATGRVRPSRAMNAAERAAAIASLGWAPEGDDRYPSSTTEIVRWAAEAR